MDNINVILKKGDKEMRIPASQIFLTIQNQNLQDYINDLNMKVQILEAYVEQLRQA